MKIDNWLKKLFHKGTPGKRLSPDDIESLRTAFKARYHSFKLLLNANNKALELMTELEEALRGTMPFGMGFVRSRITAVSTNVFQIIKHLNELAPHKYEALFERFKEIQARISPFLKGNEALKQGPLVISLKDCGKAVAGQVGAKAANLGEIGRILHLPVPNGFVVTATGYQRFLEYNDLRSEIQRRIQAAGAETMDQLYTLSASIQQLIIQAPVPSNLEEEIWRHYTLLEQEEGKDVRVAMRSSALGEDMPGLSFAGQYRSELNVSRENILQAYKEIIAGKYSLQAMAYRLNRGIREQDVAMCVACMAMVDA
ncbi:MAG TPA: pyruvate, water dikinase, partial [Desulfobacteraceae bacterium]|nr:pyruvate, water dikinase [Desulfobacteraceae bacterium]